MPKYERAADKYKATVALALKGPSDLPVRAFVPLRTQIVRPEIQQRIDEYRKYRSLHE